MKFKIGDYIKLKKSLKNQWYYHNKIMRVTSILEEINDVQVDYDWTEKAKHYNIWRKNSGYNEISMDYIYKVNIREKRAKKLKRILK